MEGDDHLVTRDSPLGRKIVAGWARLLKPETDSVPHRIERVSTSATYVTVRPDVPWASSVAADELVTLDYGADGILIGVEICTDGARSFAKRDAVV